MLDVLRSNAKSTLTWLIVGGIVVVFAVNFGPGSLSKSGCGTSHLPFAARVNGRVVSASDWERQYRQLYQLLQAQAGGALTREMAAQLGLAQQAMDQVVDRELVIQEARRRGVTVTGAELTKAVHGMPSFHENGRFSFDLYQQSVRQAYGSTAKFESALKDDLLYQKMMAAVAETVKVSDAEVRAAFESDGDRVALTFVRFPISAAEAEVAKPSAAEVAAFAEKETDRVAKFFQENRARFDQKKKVRVRHILAKVGPQASEEAAREKIEGAQARLKKGEDFAAVAAAVSDDANTRARGGDLGFVSEGLLDDEFARAALALEAGQVSEPVRTPSGWHLVKAEEVVPAKQTPLEAARLDIARELLVKDRAKALAEARARAALEAVKRGRSLEALFPSADAAKKAGQAPVTLGGKEIVAEETGTVTRGTAYVPGLGAAPEVLAAAFAAKKGDALEQETPAGPVVAIVTLRETPDPAAFERQRAALETRLRNRKESQVVGAWLTTLREGAEITTNPALLAAAAAGE